MPPPRRNGQVPRKAARAPVVASCEACGGAMTERRGKRASSGRCRAEPEPAGAGETRSRSETRELRRLVETALRTLGEGCP
jgi:hypothetical protein